MTVEEFCEKLGIEWEIHHEFKVLGGYELRVRRQGMATQQIEEITTDKENDYIIIEIG